MSPICCAYIPQLPKSHCFHKKYATNQLRFLMSVIKPAIEHPEQIAYFSGANNYCWVYFRNGEKRLLAKPISYLEGKLPMFVRVHKTVLVNPAYVKSLYQPPRKKMAGKVYLDSGEVFPVSRRRWPQVAEALQNLYTSEPADHEPDDPINVQAEAVAPKEARLPNTPRPTVLLVTDDQQNTVLAEQIIRKKWPGCPFYTAQDSKLLPDWLRDLPKQEYPTLVLLDARTLTLERLHTLRRLKADEQLNRIPVVLLVLPTEQRVNEGYQLQANSVITMPVGYRLFSQTVERICQFWLHTVTLPRTD